MKTLLVAMLLMSALTSKADFLGIHGGVGYWDTQFGGKILEDRVDLDDDLNLSGDSSYHLWIAFEHPVPVLPNIKIAHTKMKDSGDGRVTKEFEFKGTVFTIGRDVRTEIDISHTDLILYYEIVDTGLELDIGVIARWIDAEVKINSTKTSGDIVLPVLYASGKVSLPFTGTYFAGEVNYIGYDGDSLLDYTLKAGWETENFIFPEFGVEIGYRDYSVELDISSLNFDIRVDGIFVNLTAHF